MCFKDDRWIAKFVRPLFRKHPPQYKKYRLIDGDEHLSEELGCLFFFLCVFFLMSLPDIMHYRSNKQTVGHPPHPTHGFQIVDVGTTFHTAVHPSG